jgi:chromosome segregation ATPase
MKAKKPKAKGKPKSKSFTPAQVGALIESFKADFRIFGEKLKSLDEKVESIAKNQAYTLERITTIELKIVSIEERLKKLEERLSKVEEEIIEIKREIKEIKAKLDRKVDITEFKMLEMRVSALEKKVESLLPK